MRQRFSFHRVKLSERTGDKKDVVEISQKKDEEKKLF